MFTFIKNYIKNLLSKSVEVDYQLQPKMYDLSKAEKILVVVSLDVGNLPKVRAEEYCAAFKSKLHDNFIFSNKELYSILIIPVRGSIPTTMELYSLPK